MTLKELVKGVDRAVFGAFFNKQSFRLKQNAAVGNLSVEYPYQKIVHYSHDQDNPIAALCDKYGSDKGSLKQKSSTYQWNAHTYADLYYDLFGHCRLQVKAVFECGLGTNNAAFGANMGPDGKPGASLRVWRDYFPNAAVVGADIDQDILFEEERISTYYVDQTDRASIRDMWVRAASTPFDLFVDDGLHTFEAGVTLFEESWNHISADGIYIIEDVRIEDLPKFQHYFFGTKFNVQFVNLLRPGIQLDDNSIIIVRKSGEEL